jgi:hypothetical protein
MGLLDSEIKSERSECVRKPEWALCIYCKVPFLTSTFADSCERCSVYNQHKIELSSKLMIIFIVFVSVFILSTTSSLFYLSKYVRNFNIIILLLSILSILQGSVLWKIVKNVMNK